MNKRQLKKFKKKLGYKTYKRANAPLSFHDLFNRYMKITYDRSTVQKAINSFSKIEHLFTPVKDNFYCQPVILPEYQNEYTFNF